MTTNNNGPFSAVSKRIFATKYSFCSIFQDLQDEHTFAPLPTQFSLDFRKILQNFGDFSGFCEISLKIDSNRMFFAEIFTEFRRNCGKLLKIN